MSMNYAPQSTQNNLIFPQQPQPQPQPQQQQQPPPQQQQQQQQQQPQLQLPQPQPQPIPVIQQQQQQQQQLPQTNQNQITQLTKAIIDKLKSNPTDLHYVEKQLHEALEKVSDKCIFNHSILNIPSDDKNELLIQIKMAYNDYSNRNMDEKIDRVFKDFCPVCVYYKLGLLCQDVTRNLKLYSCTNNTLGSKDNNNNNNNNLKQFQLGSFIHAYNPYKADRALKHINSHHPSETIAFPTGMLLIPNGKILIQLLSLPQDTLAQGLKIIQIMSDEVNVEDARCYYRFLQRNSRTDTGYYMRTMDEDDLKKMNQTGTGEKISTNTIDQIKNLYKDLRSKGVPNVPETIDDDKSKIGVKSDENFNIDNIFQNGEPLTYVDRGMTADPDKIKMKIFDLNPVFVSYLQSIINIQNHMEHSDSSIINSIYYNNKTSFGDKDDDDNDEYKRKAKHDYISLWKPTAPILNSVYFDLLMMGFYNEMNIKKFVNIPPFNDKCVTMPQNVLFVNRNGDCIMTTEIKSDDNICSIFNKVLRKTNIPLQQKSLVTGFNHNVNEKGIPPSSKFPSDVIKTVSDSLAAGTSGNSGGDNEKISDKYKIIYNFHKSQSQTYHNTIKNNTERLKNYFCNFQDDMGNPIPFEGNEVIYDIATRMFPQRVLQSSHNKNMYSLHFTEKATTKPILEEDPNPNCVYVANLGFVNLLNMCDNTPLILRSVEVYLENLIKRDVSGYFDKTNDNCKYDADSNEDGDTTRTFSHINITALPHKRKFSESNTINLINKRANDFDYSAFNKMTSCPSPTNFGDYVIKYNNNNNNTNNNCPRRV